MTPKQEIYVKAFEIAVQIIGNPTRKPNGYDYQNVINDYSHLAEQLYNHIVFFDRKQ